MIKLNNVNKWKVHKKEEKVQFENTKIRRVKLTVNSPEKTRLYIKQGKKTQFLAMFEGYEVIEFGVEGAFQLMHDVNEVLYTTSEGEPTHAVIDDPTIFTTIAKRRERNPELELMQYQLMANMERRMQKQMAEIEAKTKKENPVVETDLKPAGPVEPVEAKPAPVPEGGTTNTPPSPQPSDDGSGAQGQAAGQLPVSPAGDGQ